MIVVTEWPARWCPHCNVGSNEEHCWHCGQRMDSFYRPALQLHSRDVPEAA